MYEELGMTDTLSTLMKRYRHFEHATFATFDRTEPDTSGAYQRALDFAMSPHCWLLLAGPTGCGKTHLAIAIAKHRIAEGDSVLVVDYLDVLNELYISIQESDILVGGNMKEAELLIIDDISSYRELMPWSSPKLVQILSHRYNACKPTVFTTDCINLLDIHPRIASQIRDRRISTIVQMAQARDYRIFGSQDEEEE